MALTIVDRREEGPWTPGYLLAFECSVCLAQHVSLYSCGYAPMMRHECCPSCLVEGRLCNKGGVEAKTLLYNHAQVLLFKQEDGHFEQQFIPVIWHEENGVAVVAAILPDWYGIG